MNNIKLQIESTQLFEYYVYNCDELITSGMYNNLEQKYILANFQPKLKNIIRFYAHNVKDTVSITKLIIDDFETDFLHHMGKFYPIPNEVEDELVCFNGTSLSRNGYIQISFDWPFEKWYFNWIDKNWIIFTQHN
jgi:hypothetical protein